MAFGDELLQILLLLDDVPCLEDGHVKVAVSDITLHRAYIRRTVGIVNLTCFDFTDEILQARRRLSTPKLRVVDKVDSSCVLI